VVWLAAGGSSSADITFSLVMFTESPDEKDFEGHLAGFYTDPMLLANQREKNQQ
jgi:hypothetical protein